MNTTKMIIVVSLIISVAMLTSALAKNKSPTPQDVPAPHYVTMTKADLKEDPRLTEWFEKSHRNEGIHTIEIDNEIYVLVCAGVKPSGGFELRIADVAISDSQTLHITAELISPNPGDVVTMALTYPHVVLRFPSQKFEKVEMELKEAKRTKPSMKP